MTFLELCQRVHRYARIGQDAPGTAPATVVDPEDSVLTEIVGWVRDAWEDIQNDKEDWLFRERSGVVTVATGVRDVDIGASVADYERLRPFASEYCRQHILVAPAGSGAESRQPVFRIDWQDWRGGRYEHGGAVDTTGTPTHFTIKPGGALRLYPKPAQAMELAFSYQAALQVLEQDADVPAMPAQHHEAIVWRALMYYADTRDKTQEPYQKWERRHRAAMNRLYLAQLPDVSF